MEEKDKQRNNISAMQKRIALVEISKGTKAKEIIKKDSQDKKYASKMFHKWKKETYSKKPDLHRDGFGTDMSDINVEYELSNFSFEDKDEILAIAQAKIDQKKEKFIKSKENYTICSDLCYMYKNYE